MKVAQELTRSGRAAEAIDDYRSALDLRRQLVEGDASNWRWRTLLAEADEGLGLALTGTGKPDEGLPLLAEAVDRYRAIVAHDARNADSRHALAISLNVYAGALASKDRAAALNAAHESLALFRALATAEAPPSAQLDVAAVLLRLVDLGEEPRKNGEEAYAIYQSLDQRGALPPAIKAMLPAMKARLDTLPKP